MTAAFFAPSGLSARGVSVASWSGGSFVVPDWTTPRYFPFVNNAFQYPVAIGAGTPGISAASSDGNNGLWFCSYGGMVWYYPQTGTPAYSQLATGNVYIGIGPSGSVLSANGTMWGSASSSGGVTGYINPFSTAFSNAFGGGAVVPPISGEIGSWPTSATAFATSGSTFLAILPASGVGTMTYNGVTGVIAYPTGVTGTCFTAAAGQSVVVGGWVNAPPLSGAAAAALDPQNSETMLAVGAGEVVLWTNTSAATGQNWLQTNSLSGVANLNSLCFNPNGIQALATSVSSGVVQVISYAVNTLSLAQTLAITGACSIAVAGQGGTALVAQSGQSRVVTLNSSISNVWSLGVPVTGLPGITSIVPYGATNAIATFNYGLAYLSYNTDVWSIAAQVTLSYTPTVVTVDPFNQVYTAGVNNLTVLSGTVVTGSGSFTGTPTSIAVQQGRLILAVPSSGLLTFGNDSPGYWALHQSYALSLGTTVGLALSEATLFALGSGATNTYDFITTPYELSPVVSGVVCLYNGASWTTTPLGIGHTPSAIIFDNAYNIQLVTSQDTWWTLSSAGVVTGSGLVTSFNGQPQSTPNGAAALISTSNGSLYCVTSLNGYLAELI